MRRVSWLVLPALAIAYGCGGAAPPPYRPVADLKQLMASIVEPAADVYWDAVGSVVDDTGLHEFEPQSVEEWDAVRNSAYVVTESANLMMMPSRAKDNGEWMTLAQALVESGQKAIKAAEARNKTAVFDTGAEIYDACTNCHAKYAVELQRPNAK